MPVTRSRGSRRRHRLPIFLVSASRHGGGSFPMATIEQQPSPRGGTGLPPLEPPSPEISPSRVALLLIVLAALAFGGWRLISDGTSAADARSDAVPVYAPYVDVTLTPDLPVPAALGQPRSSVYLGFIVSNPSYLARPQLGRLLHAEQAEQSLELGARIAQLQQTRRQRGDLLRRPRQQRAGVRLHQRRGSSSRHIWHRVKRYAMKTVDFDIEGAALGNAAADARRAARWRRCSSSWPTPTSL